MANTPSTASRLVESKDKTPPGPPSNRISKQDGHTFETSRQIDVTDSKPKNLEGKEADDIVEDYKKLQSERGRQANEIGELRRQLAELKAQSERPAEPADYYAEPEKAIEQAVEKRVKPLQDRVSQYEAETLRSELSATHPDWREIKDRPEFQEWIAEKKSRVLLAMASESGDVDSARELFDTYKEAAATGNATPREAVRRDRVARATATERGTGRRPMGVVYTRKELQNMRAFRPREYQEKLPEIKRAYAENRVRDD